MIREAKPHDVPDLVRWAAKYAMEKYPYLRISRSRIYELAKEMVGSRKHFCWRGECAALCAYTSDIIFAERQQSVVTFFFSESGEGNLLVREYKLWLQGKTGIQLAGIFPDFDAPARMAEIFLGNGFQQQGAALIWHRGKANGNFQWRQESLQENREGGEKGIQEGTQARCQAT